MSISQSPLRVRNKMIGVVLQEARKASGKSVREAADSAGLSSGTILAFENGKRSISLPELETLAYCYDVSARHLLSGSSLHSKERREKVDLSRWAQIRQKMIASRLRQMRQEKNLKLSVLSAKAGIPSRRINSYENGTRSVPLAELESLLLVLGAQPRDLLEYQGPIGTWEKGRESLERFDLLPIDLQQFVSDPLHVPYLRLAMQMSEIPANRLREIAEAILEISL
jgi:transcriptional regulator with XRE-family HTH domain